MTSTLKVATTHLADPGAGTLEVHPRYIEQMVQLRGGLVHVGLGGQCVNPIQGKISISISESIFVVSTDTTHVILKISLGHFLLTILTTQLGFKPLSIRNSIRRDSTMSNRVVYKLLLCVWFF
ncbi:hypothetical protein V1515DRAFT_371679 [Lipomyces mesembrius]